MGMAVVEWTVLGGRLGERRDVEFRRRLYRMESCSRFALRTMVASLTIVALLMALGEGYCLFGHVALRLVEGRQREREIACPLFEYICHIMRRVLRDVHLLLKVDGYGLVSVSRL